ncbi:MAG: DUF2721 domain-containing protein [Steroidobacteraceae bacterium]
MNPLGFLQMPVSDVAHAIQLSLAPVFLLSGIGVLLGMLTARLARIVDRARPMEENLKTAGTAEAQVLVDRLKLLARRARLMNRAITLSTISALLVALVVAMLFSSTFVAIISLTGPIAVLFIIAMGCLIGALLSFLLEIRVATASVRIGPQNPMSGERSSN